MTEQSTVDQSTVDQSAEEQIAPFVDEQDREIAYRSDANPAVAAGGSDVRQAIVAPSGATGRRKQAIARVRLMPGSGKWTINGRTLDEYFPNKVHQQHVSDPFRWRG